MGPTSPTTAKSRRDSWHAACRGIPLRYPAPPRRCFLVRARGHSRCLATVPGCENGPEPESRDRRAQFHGVGLPMPSVLAIVAGTPTSLEGRSLLGPALTVDRWSNAESALAEAAVRSYDLLVLAGLPVEEQQSVVESLHAQRHWRLVPVLYVLPAGSGGFIVPSGYRPELDSIASGAFGAPDIEARIRLMAKEGTALADLVVAGAFELDPLRGRLMHQGRSIELTPRETAILALLLERPDQTVAASEFIERGWGTLADDLHLQILRRHVSNLRRKLQTEGWMARLNTVRGRGYRFDLRSA